MISKQGFFGDRILYSTVFYESQAGCCPRCFGRWIAVQSVYSRYLPASSLLSVLTRSLLLGIGAAEGWKCIQPEWVFNQGLKSHQMLKKLAVNQRLGNPASSTLLWNIHFSDLSSLSWSPFPEPSLLIVRTSLLCPAFLWGCRGNSLLEAKFHARAMLFFLMAIQNTAWLAWC